MSVVSTGFQFANITINDRYVMTRAQIEALGDAEDFPDIFPIYCSEDNKVYIFYKTEDGIPKIVNYEDLVSNTENTVLYPIVNPDTNLISWEIRTLTGEVPPSVTLKGNEGKSAYQVWLDRGNTGTEEDFFRSLEPDLSNLTETQISGLKDALGLSSLETSIDNLNTSLSDILS